MTLESGYVLLEKEYRNVVNANSIIADPLLLIDSLDEQYGMSNPKHLQLTIAVVEIISSRIRDTQTVKSAAAIAKLGEWLLKRGRNKRFLAAYWIIRLVVTIMEILGLSNFSGDQMQRALMNVAQMFHNGQLTSGSLLSVVSERALLGVIANTSTAHTARLIKTPSVTIALWLQ